METLHNHSTAPHDYRGVDQQKQTQTSKLLRHTSSSIITEQHTPEGHITEPCDYPNSAHELIEVCTVVCGAVRQSCVLHKLTNQALT